MEKILNIAKALSDGNRLRALMLLRNGELCVCRLIDLLGLAPSTVSKHMAILKRASLVECRRERKWTYYRLPDDSADATVREILTWAETHLSGDPLVVADLRHLVKESGCRDDACRKIKILFLCTGNSCRSQMAEGWTRALKGDVIEAWSAGIETHGLNPRAVWVMAEAGVDISAHCSKLVKELADIEFDYVITVCGHADENCPVFPGTTKVFHVGFDDPPRLAEECRTEEKKLDCYRRVRDEIKAFVEKLPESLPGRG